MLAYLLLLAIETHQPNIPLHFEPNQGQVAGETEWIAKARGGTLYITGEAVAFATSEAGKKPKIMRFVGATASMGVGEGALESYSNYFTGRDEKNWHSGVPHYSKVRYKGLYPGIDLVYYSTADRRIEYDFEIAPGVDVRQVELAFEGFDRAELDRATGDLLIRHGKSTVTQKRPIVMQDGHKILCRYERRAERWGLVIDVYDESHALTIDPVLDFATYVGGPGADYAKVSLDSAGAVYLAGYSQTPSGPSLNPFQQTSLLTYTAFVAKFTANADRLQFFTVFAATGTSNVSGASIDRNGNILLSGGTSAPDFPVKNAFQSQLKAQSASFVMKLSSDGRSIQWSSYFGGSADGGFAGSALDANGDLILGGHTSAKDIPIVNPYQPQFGGGQYDCVLAKVSNSGKLVFSTFFGGNGLDFCSPPSVDRHGDIWVAGQSYSTDLPLKNAIQTTLTTRNGFSTPFIARFSNDGQQLKYSTFLGGVGSGGAEVVSLNSKDEIYVSAFAFFGDFLVKNAYQNTSQSDISMILMKLDPTGQQIITSTYFGGSGRSTGTVMIGTDDTVYVAGTAASSDFPVKDSLQPLRDMSFTNKMAFVARFTPDLRTLIYSTVLGGSRNQECCSMALDSQNRVYITSWTGSDDNRVKNAFQSTFGGTYDIWLARISDTTVALSNPVTASPSQIIFQQPQGGPAFTSKPILLDGPPSTYTASADAAWVTINPKSGSIPGSLQIGAAVLSPGTYKSNVTITPSSGTAPLTVTVTLTILTPAPVLSSVEPSFVPIGSDDTDITFHGSGFTPQSRLRLYDGDWAAPVTFVDEHTLRTRMSFQSFVVEASYRFSVVNPGSDISQPMVVSVGRVSPSIASVVNAASLQPGPIAPGELLTIIGTDFGLPGKLGVTIGGLNSIVVQSATNQVTVVVPSSGLAGDSVAVVVNSDTLASAPLKLPLVAAAPGVFTVDGSGVGQALISGTAAPGSTITLFGTGGGDLSLTVTVSINGEDAPVTSVSAVADKPGWFQVMTAIPADAPTDAPVTVILTVGGQSSQTGVTLALQGN